MLIRCIECGNEISDKSNMCPNCGCPTIESIKEIENNNQKKENEDKLFYECPLCKKQYESGTLKCDLCGYMAIPMPPQNNVKIQNLPKCPTCSSTNIKKISTTRKVAGAIGFGLLSKTAKSQFECNDCGYKW